MSFNGSGTFGINATGYPIQPEDLAYSTVFNAIMTELETGLSQCITKDGQTTLTQNLSLSGKNITNLLSATALTHAMSLYNGMVNTGTYVSTVGGTVDAITLTPSPSVASANYTAGMEFFFVSTGANTGAVTVAVSGLSTKSITKNGATALSAGDIPSGAIVHIVYDGTRFQKI
jgi:hypothetical protein